MNALNQPTLNTAQRDDWADEQKKITKCVGDFLKELFRRADNNNDGMLDNNEFLDADMYVVFEDLASSYYKGICGKLMDTQEISPIFI